MKTDYLYSKNKVLKHLNKLNKIKSKKDVVPALVRIDITNSCNHRCIYCMYQQSLQEFGLCDSFSFKDTIKIDELKDFIKDIKKTGVKAMMFAGGGEPTIHPDFKEATSSALKSGLEVGIITNGTGLDKTWSKLLKNKNLKWIRISLDASKQTTWKKIHRPLGGNNFNEINNLVKYFKKNNIKTKIGASFVINDLNWKEILESTKLCKKIGYDDIRISFTYQIKREKLYKKYKDKILYLLYESQRLSNKKFYVNVLKDRLTSLETKNKDYENCYFSYFSISIGADFKVYPCCMTKYAKRFCIADLRKERFNKKLIKKINTYIRALNVKKCPTCWYDNFNKTGEYYCKNVDYENFIN